MVWYVNYILQFVNNIFLFRRRMTVKEFKLVKLVLMLGLVVVVIGAMFLDNTAMKQGSLVVFLGLGVYMVLVSLLKTRVDGVLEDERQLEVAGNAAQVSFRILMPILLLSSAALIMGGGSQEFYYIRALGIVLSYVTCLGLVIYLLAFWYFDRRSGGGGGD